MSCSTCRVQRVERAGERRMGTVDREHVLRQVVRADREESRVRGKASRADRRGGVSTMIPTGIPVVALHGGRELAHERSHGLDFPGVVHHRQQDATAAARADREYRGELRAQELRAPQAHADATQAECRVVLRGISRNGIGLSLPASRVRTTTGRLPKADTISW
jgi:hypothetical protein